MLLPCDDCGYNGFGMESQVSGVVKLQEAVKAIEKESYHNLAICSTQCT